MNVAPHPERRGIVAVASFAAAASVILLFLDNVALNALLGVPLALGAPGYALDGALGLSFLVGVRNPRTSLLERLILVVVASLLILPFLGLFLEFSGIGLRRESVLVALAVSTVALSLLALRRRAYREPARDAPERAPWTRRRAVLVGAVGAAGLALVALLVVAAHMPPPVSGATDLSVLLVGADPARQPFVASPAQALTWNVTLDTVEPGPITLTLNASIQAGVFAGENATVAFVPSAEPTIIATLAPSLNATDTLRLHIDAQAPAKPGLYRVAFELRRPGEPDPYRSVYDWLEVQ